MLRSQGHKITCIVQNSSLLITFLQLTWARATKYGFRKDWRYDSSHKMSRSSLFHSLGRSEHSGAKVDRDYHRSFLPPVVSLWWSVGWRRVGLRDRSYWTNIKEIRSAAERNWINWNLGRPDWYRGRITKHACSQDRCKTESWRRWLSRNGRQRNTISMRKAWPKH